MKKKLSLNRLIRLALMSVFFLVPPSFSGAASLDEIVPRLQKQYEAISTVSADFKQEVTAGGTAAVSEGKVFFKKPGMMKWIYRKPVGDVLVSDGKTIRYFQSDLNQVMEKPVEGRQDGATDFLTGVGNLKKDFRITLVKEDVSVYRLGLSPRNGASEPNLKKFYIEVDKTNFLVVKTIAENYYGAVTTVSFRNISLNAPIKNSFFEFSPPKGAAVIKP